MNPQLLPAAPPVVALGFSLEVIAIFTAVVALSVYADLWAHRDGREITLRNAAAWSALWIGLALGFGGYLHTRFSPAHASLFLSGWMLEKALSVDNLIVFMAIFRYFRMPSGLQHRVLYLGILGAVVLRMAFVALAGMVRAVGPWADVVFALVVLASGVKMLRGNGDEEGGCAEDFSQHKVVRLAQQMFSVIPRLDGLRFFVTAARAKQLLGEDFALLRPAARYATPAFVCMLLVEASDVMFAFDSVPAVIAVTREPVLIYSAMLFAVLGLRSLFFLLSALTRWLVHLEKSVVFLLFFVGAKLMLHAANELFHWPGYEPTPQQSIVVILGTLGLGVVASLLWPGDCAARARAEASDVDADAA